MTEKRVQRRLAAIAIADVVGYSRMMGVDETSTLAALNQRRIQIIEPVVREHQGRIVKLMGDGFFIEFASAVNAVEAALELQFRMAVANADLPEDGRIVLRIGINVGEVIVEGDDLYGDGVNVAARLESIAPPGGIALSGNVHDQIRNKIVVTMEDIGEQNLKNIAEPVRVFYVTATPAAVSANEKTKTVDDKPTIAILPFANMGDDLAQGYFSDGITEDIITELSRWRMLAVRSRSASFRYRGVAVDMKQVARELNVRFILEGSVRQIGSRIRITAQLIDTETGSHIWAQKFDCESNDLFSVQDQVVRTIVSTLVGRLQASDTERARRKPPSSLAAYECVLHGNALPWSDPVAAAEANRLFEKAIKIDPGYGLAHALLAVMRHHSWLDDTSGSDVLLDEAYEFAKRAVELDENESTCFSMLSVVCVSRHSYDLALQYAQRAIEINPCNQWNRADMGSLLVNLGQPEAALVWFQQAREIDPYFDQHWYWRELGRAYILLHRYEEALTMFEHVSIRQFKIAALKAACYSRLGHMDRARVCAMECMAMKQDFSISYFLRKWSFKNPEHARELAESLRMAGLPVVAESAWVNEVLQFWFVELSEAQWYAKHKDIDAKIRDRFLELHAQLLENEVAGLTSWREILAAVVVLDQFSRNMFRDNPRAFSADPLARRLARLGIELGVDREMTNKERLFLYLPFEHSEDAVDQHTAFELIRALGNEDWTHYAKVHKDIIDCFGRFPHRNAALNRPSTPDEIELLKDPTKSF